MRFQFYLEVNEVTDADLQRATFFNVREWCIFVFLATVVNVSPHSCPRLPANMLLQMEPSQWVGDHFHHSSTASSMSLQLHWPRDCIPRSTGMWSVDWKFGCSPRRSSCLRRHYVDLAFPMDLAPLSPSGVTFLVFYYHIPGDITTWDHLCPCNSHFI